jgi:hypothetical protein
MTPVLEAALAYYARRWSLIPLRMQDKIPARRWKQFQHGAAAESTIRKWFRNEQFGVAVVFGAVSGNLVSRDFDELAAYHRWANEHPELAATLPTVETRRGRHVYATASHQNVQEARRRLGKSADSTGAILVEGGELRAGVGCYSVLPPSVHPSGHVYRWLTDLPAGKPPVVNLLNCGFVDFESCYGENRRITERDTEAIVSNGVGIDSIEVAIAVSLPTGPGRRNEQVFVLARALKALPHINDADPKALRSVVQKWHQQALPYITTKPFEETWIDFLKAWPKVRFPLGAIPMAIVMERVNNSPLPVESERFEQPELKRLLALCRELQRSCRNAPFFLSCRKAGELLGVTHMTANRWLFLLVAEGLLKLDSKGDEYRASRYRYLPEL